jgi:hypothetical protein
MGLRTLPLLEFSNPEEAAPYLTIVWESRPNARKAIGAVKLR